MDFRRLWRNLFWFALSFAVVVVPSLAFAENYPAVFYLGVGTGKYSDPSSWFAAWAPTQSSMCGNGFTCAFQSSSQSANQVAVTYSRTYQGTTYSGYQTSTVWAAWCPSGGTLSGTYPTTQCINAEPCPPGQVRGSDGLCAPPPCQAGTSGTMRLSIGYAMTADSGGAANVSKPSGACEGQCAVSVGAVVSGSCEVELSSGPQFPAFCSFETTTTGSSCTAGETTASEAAKNPPPAPCPTGTAVGSVNEVSGCYPTSTTTKETTKTTNPDSTTTEQTTEETCTGDQCTTKTTTKTCDQAGNCTESTSEGPPQDTTPTEEPTAEEEELQDEMCKSDPSQCAGKFTKADKGTFDLAAANSEKAAAEQRVRDKIAQIRSEAAGMWGGVSGGGGALPVLASFSVLGQQTTWQLKPEWLDWLPTVVMLMAAILAAFILFRD